MDYSFNMKINKKSLDKLFVAGTVFALLFTASCASDKNTGNRELPAGQDVVGDTSNLPGDAAGDTGNVNTGPAICRYEWNEEIKKKTDLSDIESGYSETQWFEGALATLERLYPYGKWVLEQVGKADTDQWFDDKSSFKGMFLSLSTGVHEDIHFLTANKTGQTGDTKYVFPVGVDKFVSATDITTPPRLSIGKYVDPAVSSKNNMYKLYFTNDEESGMADQDMFSTLDELNAYTTDELLGYIQSQYSSDIASNCGYGLYSFMYFTELSLKAFRKDHKADYEAFLKHRDELETILTLWSRASFVYNIIKDQNTANSCGFYKQEKAELVKLIFSTDVLGEIDRIRDAYCQ